MPADHARRTITGSDERNVTKWIKWMWRNGRMKFVAVENGGTQRKMYPNPVPSNTRRELGSPAVGERLKFWVTGPHVLYYWLVFSSWRRNFYSGPGLEPRFPSLRVCALRGSRKPYLVNVKILLCSALSLEKYGICSRDLQFLQLIYESFECDLTQGFFYLWFQITFWSFIHTLYPLGACDATDPGSIPGRDKFPSWGFFRVFLNCKTIYFKFKF